MNNYINNYTWLPIRLITCSFSFCTSLILNKTIWIICVIEERANAEPGLHHTMKEKTLTEKIRGFLCFTWSLTHDLFITCQSMHKLLNESQMYSHIKGQNMTHQTHKNCIPVHGWFRLLILPLQHSKASERDNSYFHMTVKLWTSFDFGYAKLYLEPPKNQLRSAIMAGV